MKVLRAAAALCIAAGAFAAVPAMAQQVSRIVTPFGAGGPVDALIRPLAAELSKSGDNFIVENKVGGSGMIAVDYVKRSKADGRTLLMGSNSTMVTNTVLFEKLPYDPKSDFVPIGMIAHQVGVMVVRQNAPYNTFAQMLEYARANPGKINRASIGPGTVSNLGAVLLEKQAKYRTTQIPFNAEAAVVQAILSGDVDMYAGPISATTIEHVRSGKLKALTVLAPGRTASLPDVATVKELGYDVEAVGWYALFAPAGTPPEVVTKLTQQLNHALANKELADRARSNVMELKPGTAAAVTKYMEADLERWAPIIEGMGLPKQ